MMSTNLSEEYGAVLKKAHDYLKASQVIKLWISILPLFVGTFFLFNLLCSKMKVLADYPGDLSFWYRHISKGAWPFSTADHGWPISDCTSEGLKVSFHCL